MGSVVGINVGSSVGANVVGDDDSASRVVNDVKGSIVGAAVASN